MLDVTGPKLFRRALEQSRQRYRLKLEQTNDKLLVFMRPGDREGEIAIRTKLPNHDVILGKTSENSYVDLYKWGSIYKWGSVEESAGGPDGCYFGYCLMGQRWVNSAPRNRSPPPPN